MTDRELLQQALDALISVWNMDKTTKQVESIQAIKARLAQDDIALEDGFIPVQGYWGKHFVEIQHPTKPNEIVRFKFDAQPELKPVSWAVQEGANLHDVFLFKDEAVEMSDLKGTHAKAVPLYTAPPKKECVGLTDEEIEDAVWESGKDGLTGNRYDVALAVEAKLKEKNNG